jgi:integrase/recombinase XerD
VKRFLAYLRDNDHRYNTKFSRANRPISPTTIKRFYACLRVLFNWAIHEGILESSPLATIKPPKEARHVVRALTAEQAQKVVAALDGRGFAAIRNKSIVLVLVDSGVRLGELAGYLIWRRRRPKGGTAS